MNPQEWSQVQQNRQVFNKFISEVDSSREKFLSNKSQVPENRLSLQERLRNSRYNEVNQKYKMSIRALSRSYAESMKKFASQGQEAASEGQLRQFEIHANGIQP